MQLRDWVTQERKKRGWSKKRLAEEAKVSASVITRLENGERLGHAVTIARVTNVLGMDPAAVERSLRQEHEEERETQYVDLSKIPIERRPLARDIIDAVVRRLEEGH
ncbi:MAG: helix-turn-helix domain-containing protein [Chloroflexota bacterium]